MGKQVAKILLFAGGVWLMIFLCCGGLMLSVDDNDRVDTPTKASDPAIPVASAPPNAIPSPHATPPITDPENVLPPIMEQSTLPPSAQTRPEPPIKPRTVSDVDFDLYISSLPDYRTGAPTPARIDRLTVLQVTGPNEFRADYGDDDLYVTGVSTSGMVDGATYKISHGVFVDAGTQSYTTIFGAPRTIRAIRRLDVSEIMRLAVAKMDEEEASMRAAEAEREAERQAEMKAAAARREPDSIGKFKGAMLHHDNGNIHLRNQRLKELIDEYSDTTGGKQAREFIDTELGGELK